jgi:hypothetical protein
MLASINPLGERARGTRWGRTVAWYFAGSIVGGSAIGGLAGAAGALAFGSDGLPGSTAAALVAGAAAVGLVLDLGLGGLHLPTVRRQVDEDWLVRYRGWLYGGGFGFQLGLAVITVVTTSTVYLMLVLAALSADPGAGVLIGAVFGVVRALPLFVVADVHDPGRLRARVGAMADAAAPASTFALVSVAVVIVAGSVAAVY